MTREGPPDWITHPWVAEAEQRVRFGVDLGPPPIFAASLEWARMVEQLGFDSFWLRDHPARAPEDPFTFLAAVAGVTNRIRLGTLVASAPYRHPLLLARVAADVDRLSNGRLVLGVGGGWDAREFEQMGIVLPPPRERLEALEETIRILTGVWGDAPFTFAGKYLRVTEARVQPGPVQTPRVPLLIGGGGERGTLRLVARYADASNIEGHGATGAQTAEQLVHKYDVLRGHCAAIGRPYASILRTYFRVPVIVAETAAAVDAKRDALPEALRDFPGMIAGTPAAVIATLAEFVRAGVRYFIFILADEETARLLAERVLPEVVSAD